MLIVPAPGRPPRRLTVPDPTLAAPPAEEPWLEVTASRTLPAWMLRHRVSLAFTTYQTGKMFLVGVRPP